MKRACAICCAGAIHKIRKRNKVKQTTQLLRFGLAALLFAMTSPALLAAPANAGIQGRAAVYIAYGTPTPISPGVWVGPGDVMMPVASSFSILSARSGHKIGNFSADANGMFTISLPPGRYIIVPDAFSFSGFPSANSISTDSFVVTVRARKFSYALILYYQKGPLSLTGLISDSFLRQGNDAR
jgi:hypothetical protein